MPFKIAPAVLAAAFTVSTFTAVAIAGGHLPQEKRQQSMKAVGKNMGIVGKMAKGGSTFDAEVALAAFKEMQEASSDYETLFPEGSEEGAETEASPKIFSDRAGFEAKVAEFKASLAKATAAAPADVAALGATVGMVGKNCGACHELYRVKKD